MVVGWAEWFSRIENISKDLPYVFLKFLAILLGVGNGLLTETERRIVAVGLCLLNKKQGRADGQSVRVKSPFVTDDERVEKCLQVIVGVMSTQQ